MKFKMLVEPGSLDTVDFMFLSEQIVKPERSASSRWIAFLARLSALEESTIQVVRQADV